MTEIAEKFKVGFEYEWAKMPDGTYKLFNVPIFQETVDKRGGKNKKYTRKDLEQIVNLHNELQNKYQHAPSVHWGHNSRAEGEKEKLGEAVNFRLGELFGKATIFCDIESIEPKIFEKIKKGKLPHVSVEIPHTDPPRIGSIAFLSSNTPYFTLPNIRAGKEVKNFSSSDPTQYSYFENGSVSEFINCFIGDTAMTIFQDKELEKEEEKKEEMQEEGGSDLEARISALEEKVAEIMELLQSQKEPESSANPIAEEKQPEEGQMSFGKSDLYWEVQSAVADALAPIKKELSKVKEYAKKQELEKNAEKALRYFDASGIVVDPIQFKKKFIEKAEKYGVDAAREYVEEIKDYGMRAPIGSTFQYEDLKPSDPEYLEKYKEEGKEEFQAALEADRFYTKNASYLAQQGISREDYIEGEVASVRIKKKGLV